MTRAELLEIRKGIPPLKHLTKRPKDALNSIETKQKSNEVNYNRELEQIEKAFSDYEY